MMLSSGTLCGAISSTRMHDLSSHTLKQLIEIWKHCVEPSNGSGGDCWSACILAELLGSIALQLQQGYEMLELAVCHVVIPGIYHATVP